MAKRVIVLLLLMTGARAFAQSPYVDSLENLLGTGIHDTVRVWAMNELSRERAYGSPEKSLQLANQALQLANEIGYQRGEAYSYRMLASIDGTRDHYLAYSQYLHKAIKLFMELQDSVGLANCYI
ncbi:MAG: hypothetical protein KDC77_15405, partial [Cyclobacteriaceae bacterium]|nr:hypothetical protein [Cyclobacteriaceae bacterium]